MEFYSPRNELEALNSIILLTDISLSSCTHLHTNILQGLRQTILDLISDFGDKNSVKGIVGKDHSCDQEEHLMEWGESNGAMTRLKIACKFTVTFFVFQLLSHSLVSRARFSFLCAGIRFPLTHNTNFFPP